MSKPVSFSTSDIYDTDLLLINLLLTQAKEKYYKTRDEYYKALDVSLTIHKSLDVSQNTKSEDTPM